MPKFEEICNDAQKAPPTSQGAFGMSLPNTSDNSQIIHDLLSSFTNPSLIPYHEIHEDWKKSPFETYKSDLVLKLLNLYFQMRDKKLEMEKESTKSKECM